jgi:MFS transporter, DHA1 family, inner membrane transport protein
MRSAIMTSADLTVTGHRPRRTAVVLGVLFLGTFVMGSAELLVVGVLNLMARALHIADGSVGILVTAYALGLAFGGPLLAIATARVARRRVLLAALASYIVVTAATFSAGSFPVLVVARVVTGSAQGLFVGAAFAIATSLVPPERVGRAMSSVIGGFAVSAAIGVPAGTLVGQHFGWRAAFLIVAVLGTLVFIAAAALVPRSRTAMPAGPGSHLREALSPRVVALLALAVVLFAGSYGALTFITPFLRHVTHISETWITAFLLVYGAATACGAFGGGRFADRNAARALVTGTAVLVAVFAVLLSAGRVPVIAAVALAAWGLFGFGLVPSLQYRVVSLAGSGAAVAATLPASAINAGIALGSVLGGWALTTHGPSAPAGTAIILTAIALLAAVATSRLQSANAAPATSPPPDTSTGPVTVPAPPMPCDAP